MAADLTPYQAFLFASAIYDPVPPGVFTEVLTVGDIVVGYTVDQDGDTVVAFRGSERRIDFIADAMALPMHAGPLGMVHTGAYQGMPAVWDALRPLLKGTVSIIGHSLGAMRAAYYAGLCAVHGVPVGRLFLFEPARPGYMQLGNMVKSHVRFILGTRNARDFVPDLPPELPLQYRHIVDLVNLNHPAPGMDPVEDHLIAQIGPGILKLWPECPTLSVPVLSPSI